jgi:hypothetical protein
MKTPNNQKVISDSGNLQDYQDRSSANQAESIFSPVRFEQSDREKEAYRKIQKLYGRKYRHIPLLRLPKILLNNNSK